MVPKALGALFAALIARVPRQLPTYDGTKSYQNLLVGVYGGQESKGNLFTTNSDSIIHFQPIAFIRGGNYNCSSGSINNLLSSFGTYWESRAYLTDLAWYFNLNFTTLDSQAGSPKGNGYSLRCLVR